MSNNKKCLAIFVVLAKAFITVPHDNFLIKLEKYGIKGVMLKLNESYLAGAFKMFQVKLLRLF